MSSHFHVRALGAEGTGTVIRAKVAKTACGMLAAETSNGRDER